MSSTYLAHGGQSAIAGSLTRCKEVYAPEKVGKEHTNTRRENTSETGSMLDKPTIMFFKNPKTSKTNKKDCMAFGVAE